MNTTENMFWGDINDVVRFTENTEENKGKSARKTSSVILAAVQLMENFIKGIKSLSAYEAASLIVSETYWLKKNRETSYRDENGKQKNLEVGMVYYIDYGKTFAGELAYKHYGLCIGKREGKPLIIPMTSGKDYIANCYHPVKNPNKNKKYRQALKSEGFSKDCVLLMDDARFLSAGRIEREDVKINEDILKEIQLHFFRLSHPDFYQEYVNLQKKSEKNKEEIQKLKAENNQLKQKLKHQSKTLDNAQQE